MFTRTSSISKAIEDGKFDFCSFRKAPSQASTAEDWVDYSMAAGNPPPNYYASDPGVAATLTSTRGLFFGTDADNGRFLWKIGASSGSAGITTRPIWLMDYLLYYPFVDLDSTDEQVFDNTVTLPRYTDGVGVFPVMVAAAPTTGSGSFTFNYEDSKGISRTSPVNSCATAVQNIASIITSQVATAAGGRPFLTLAEDGAGGVRSITSITMIVPNGGLATIVLVRPLTTFVLLEANTPMEIEFPTNRPDAIRIYNGAYLNYMGRCAASVSGGALSGYISTVRG